MEGRTKMKTKIKFPSIANVAAELRNINASAEGECYIDVRLQVNADGWTVHSGDSSYDTDHRGWWGASSVPGNKRRFNSENVARDLIGQARDDHAQNHACAGCNHSTPPQSTPPAAPTGYRQCSCRDCMDIAIGRGMMCSDCAEHECNVRGERECNRPDAYGCGEETPACAASMGCLCAGHARGNDASAPCDASETPPESSELAVKGEPAAGMTARAATTGQPAWRTLYATDYSRVETDDTGVYAPEMEVAQDIGDGSFELFRFGLDRLQSVFPDGGAHCLIPVNYGASWPHPAADYDAWFTRGLCDVASSCGTTHRELVEAFTSDDVRARAWAYECVGGYHGFMNLDSDPLRLTEDELNTRWNRTVR